MYIRRRIAVGTLALLVLGGLVVGGVFAVRGVVGLFQMPGDAVASAEEAAERTVEPEPVPTAVPTPSEEPSAEPTEAEPTETCAEDSVTVTARTDQTDYAEDESPSLELVVATDADAPCLIDVGTAQQEFIVNQDGEQVWSSADCYDVDGDRDTARVMEAFVPEQERSSVMDWDRSPSAQGCPAIDEKAEPGEYELVVVLGTIESEPVEFTLQ